jgi:hypothetical protein
VSSHGGAGLAPVKGRASQPQRHMALGSDPVQGQGSPNAINIIIFIIFEGNNIKNTIICVININISTIIQSMNIKNIIICGMNIIICGTNIFIFIIIESINIYFYCISKY